jgi:hypothetical protein
MKETLIKLYIEYYLTHSNSPHNVFLFAQFAKMDEETFYKNYASLDALEADIYGEWFKQTMTGCINSSPWAQYSTREKVLAICYTYIETIKPHRTFITLLKKRDFKNLPHWPKYLNGLHTTFKQMVEPILREGITSAELAERKYLDAKYVDVLWVNFLFVLKFWIEDDSEGFEKTDAAIEKSINLAMDLMAKGPLDAALDFGKFLFQNR